MTIRDLSSDQITDLVGTRHQTTGVEFPPAGLQPYHEWLVRQLHHLAESSCGALRVMRDDESATTVRVMPGRASIDLAVLAYAGGVFDLAAFNNDTAYLWLEDDSGAASIGVATSGSDWPGTAHLKLAEVTIAAGVVTDILDRRFESILSV
ncbi:MAG: hypothetical protein IT445_12770 [Phycisphaeraceae bacterium]|nr:hypothetical protein [Phycisphaeraceae bacterium]